MSYVIGLDLSTVSTGVVRVSGVKLLDALTIKPNSKLPTDERVRRVATEVVQYCATHRANTDVIIIEDVYKIRRNTQCLLELRGAIKVGLMDLNIPYKLISASRARYLGDALPKGVSRKTLTRDEKKAIVMQVVNRYYGTKFANTDESDAALLCMTHLMSRGPFNGKTKTKTTKISKGTRGLRRKTASKGR